MFGASEFLDNIVYVDDEHFITRLADRGSEVIVIN